MDDLDSSAVAREAGWVGMVLLLYLEPSTVSFEWIMKEIPVPSSEAIALLNGDYFAVKANVLPCTHDSAAGAGKWVIPQLFNDGSHWMGDRARIPYSCPPISNNPIVAGVVAFACRRQGSAVAVCKDERKVVVGKMELCVPPKDYGQFSVGILGIWFGREAYWDESLSKWSPGFEK